MRTTLTLDDDLGEELQRRARESGESFKDVVNDVIRRGLHAAAAPEAAPESFVVEPRACGFRPGVDPGKLNQILDELEIDDFETASKEMKIADS